MKKSKILLISLSTIGIVSLVTVSAIAIPLSISYKNNGFINDSNNKPDNPNPSPDPSDPDKPDIKPDPIEPDNPNTKPDGDKYWGDPNAIIGQTSTSNSLGKSSPAHPDDKDNAIIIANGGPKTDMEGQERVSALEGYITNDKYLNLAKRSVSLNFYDGNGPHMGTGWILDYKLSENNSYPLTWYFATNAHVAYNLLIHNDYNGYNSYYSQHESLRTKELRLRKVNNPIVGSKYYGNSQQNKSNYEQVIVPLARLDYSSGSAQYVYDENPLVKTVFIATDFLKSDPSDYNKDPRWVSKKETADFAVIEVTFENEQDAKSITNNYANWPKEDQFHIAPSLLTQGSIKENDYYTFGFPNIIESGFVDTIRIYCNQRKDIDINNPPNHGSSLSNSTYYSSYDDVIPGSKGMYDGVLNFSWFSQSNPFTKESYLYWGLFYTLRHDDLPPGASGSMMMNSKKETLGIQFAMDNTTDYGIIQALRSEGYNYSGKYKWYNPEPYDLVYGGFSNQKNSYKDSLFKVKPSNYKTNLFPNGNV